MTVTGARTTTSYALLGLLAVRDWTTYELAKQVKRSLNWFWPRAERKLYDEPKRLVEQGLATSVRELTGRRGRTVYRITEQGRAALRDWLSEPPEPRSIEFEGMVKVFFADAGTPEQLLATIEQIEAEAAGRIAALAEMAATRPVPFPQRAHLSAIGLRLQYEQEAAVLRWARWARKQIVQWDGTADPGDWSPIRALDELAAAKRP
ncbi:PadR family transcriptional regulator [Dactylosporangium sp. NPDC049140]|uniref:PadR family transcriptional regulator n=1 Tax=Dactylosporangium sp. NPDC049140 TaxID=3155647 RepID=UPI0034025BD7